jgi:hypothetical protein
MSIVLAAVGLRRRTARCVSKGDAQSATSIKPLRQVVAKASLASLCPAAVL